MRFLDPAALRDIDAGAIAAFRVSDECVISAGDGEIRGLAAVALLSSDYAVLTRDSIVHLDAPAIWDAIARRAGRVAIRLLLAGTASLSAGEALALGVCDEVISEAPHVWFERWIGKRSEAALDAAAVLIREPSGDAKEREVFAKLFATGEPQRGMRAFLARRG